MEDMMIREIANATETAQDFDTFMQHYNTLSKIFKAPEGKHLKFVNHGKNETTYAYFEFDTEKITLPAGTKLIHYSDIDLATLKSSFKASDHVWYGENRIYFFLDDSVNMDRIRKYRYEYICDGTESFYPDPEFGFRKVQEGKISAVFISSGRPFELTKIIKDESYEMVA